MLNTITNIDAGSPLEGRARVGDTLVSINGHEVRTCSTTATGATSRAWRWC